MMNDLKYGIILLLIATHSAFAQSVEGNVDNLPVKEYTITINKATVNKAGKMSKA